MAGRGLKASLTCLPAADLPTCRDRQLRADDRPDAGRERGLVKARRAVDAVAIEQRERRIAELGGAIDERFGQRRALEKTEGGRGVELDVHRTGRHDRNSFNHRWRR